MSIKNKLVTAVTTAGLLAGLFGSAFVPAVRAATTGAVAFAPGSSAEDYNDTTGLIAYYSASVYPQAAFVYTPATADDALSNGAYELTISGATIRSCTVTVAAGGPTVTAALINSAQTSCLTTYAWSTADAAITFNITTSKLAAGASATVTVVDPDGDTVTPTVAKTLTGVASTALASAVNATESAKTLKMNSDGTGGTAGATTDVADEVISGVNYFLPAQPLQKATWSGVVSNGYGTALSAATSLIAEVSNANYTVGCDDTLDGADTSSGATIQQFNSSAAGVWECQVHSDGAKSVGGSFTLTVKTSITGAVIATVSAAFYGEVASITASLVDGDRVPEVAGADVDDFVKLVVKDAAGRAYGLAETNALTITGYGTVAGGTTAGAEDMADGTSAATKNYFKLDDDFCPASSTGKTASVQAATVNATGTSIKSNALTINCAAAAADALTIQKIEFSKNNPLPGEAFDVYVYMEDADGVLAGAGDGASADFALALTAATDNETRWDGTTVDAFTAGTPNVFHVTTDGYGRFVLEIKAPATVGTAITVSDPSSSAIAKVYTTNDAYEGVLTVGPKKLKATADFGPAAAKKKVAFVLESASGTTKTYYRRANASGVASFTLVVRGTWTVYATFGDEISDTGTMRR